MSRQEVAMIGILCCWLAGQAHADVYKCVEASGKTVFRDRPCVAGSVPVPPMIRSQDQRSDGRQLQDKMDQFSAEQDRIIALLLSGIDATPLPVDYQARVDHALAQRLKDPDSRKVIVISTPRGGLVCGTVNARNSYGGYTGVTPFVAYFLHDGQVRDVQVYDATKIEHLADTDLMGRLFQVCRGR